MYLGRPRFNLVSAFTKSIHEECTYPIEPNLNKGIEMNITLKAISDGVNEYKDELLFNKAVNEIKNAINAGHLLEAAMMGEYSYTVNLSEKPKFKFVVQIRAEIEKLGLDCTCCCMYGLIERVKITWA